jgi:hypothetical protein
MAVAVAVPIGMAVAIPIGMAVAVAIGTVPVIGIAVAIGSSVPSCCDMNHDVMANAGGAAR